MGEEGTEDGAVFDGLSGALSTRQESLGVRQEGCLWVNMYGGGSISGLQVGQCRMTGIAK